MLPYFKFSALHYTHFLTNECHISESGSRCVIGKCCLVHFQPFNGEAQTLIISLYLVLESHLTFQKFQNSSPRLQYPTICPYDEKILGPWISTLMLCRFVDPGISLAFLVKGYMRSLYTFCSTGRIVRKHFLHSSTFTTDFLLFYAETSIQRNYAGWPSRNTWVLFSKWRLKYFMVFFSPSAHIPRRYLQLGIVRFLIYSSSASIWKLSSRWTLCGLYSYTYLSLNFVSYSQRC